GCGRCTIEDSVWKITKPEAALRVLDVRARYDEELVIVELVVRDRDEGFMLASVVPPKDRLRRALGLAEFEDTLYIADRATVLREGETRVLAGEFQEEVCRWELFLITDHDKLLATRDRPECVDREYLAGLIDE